MGLLSALAQTESNLNSIKQALAEFGTSAGQEHLTKTESSNIAAETSHGEDPSDISLAEIDKRNATATEDECNEFSSSDMNTRLSSAREDCTSQGCMIVENYGPGFECVRKDCMCLLRKFKLASAGAVNDINFITSSEYNSKYKK